MSNAPDKKKTIILASLVVVVLGVGVVQFVGSGSGSDSKKTSSKSSKNSKSGGKKSTTDILEVAKDVSAESEVKASETNDVSGEITSAPESKAVDSSVSAVVEDQDQKMANNAATIEDIESSLDSAGNTSQGLYAARDPFSVPAPAREKGSKSGQKPGATEAKATAASTASTNMTPAQRAALIARNTANAAGPVVPPMSLGGLPPVAPGSPVSAPPVGGKNGVSVKSAAPLREQGEFAFTLTGIVVGSAPLAILKDDSGKEVMVRLGGRIQDGRVIRILQDRIVLDRKGKSLTLRIGGGSGQT